MKIIFNATDIIEAHIVSGMLNANGIETYVGGYYLQGGVGEACGFNYANVQVSEADFKFALPLISNYEASPNSEGEASDIDLDGELTAI